MKCKRCDGTGLTTGGEGFPGWFACIFCYGTGQVPDDEPKCNSCGVIVKEHLGLEGTCRQLQEAKAEIQRLKTKLQTAKEILETQLSRTLELEDRK